MPVSLVLSSYGISQSVALQILICMAEIIMTGSSRRYLEQEFTT